MDFKFLSKKSNLRKTPSGFNAKCIVQVHNLSHKNIIAHLDSPASAVYTEKVALSGWVYFINQIQNYKIKVKSRHMEIELVSDINRNDSISSIEHITNEKVNHVLGFYSDAIPTEGYSIYIEYENEVIEWARVEFVVISDEDFLSYENFKNQIQKGDKVNSAHHQHLKYYLDELKINHFSTPYNNLELNKSEKKAFEFFLSVTCQSNFLSEILTQVKHKDEIKIASPFNSKDRLKLIDSFFIDEEQFPFLGNILKFKSRLSTIYIVQFIHSVNLIFIPEKLLMIDLGSFKYTAEELNKIIQKISNQETVNHNKKIGGLFINGWTPYHFFYDIVPAFELCYLNHVFKDFKIPLISLNSHSYYPIRKIYSIQVNHWQVYTRELKVLNLENYFYILCGYPISKFSENQIETMDKRLLDFSTSIIEDPDFNKQLNSLDKESPVIWIGLSLFKRGLKNQVEIFSELIQKLSMNWPHITIVFDGITSNIFNKNTYINNINDEKKVMNSIIENINSANIKYIDLIGRTSVEKLALSKNVSFFISGYATASMYPARFAKKPGIGHSPNCMSNESKNGHIQYQMIQLPASLIEDDLKSATAEKPDTVSYSLKKEKFINFAMDKINQHLVFCAMIFFNN